MIKDSLYLYMRCVLAALMNEIKIESLIISTMLLKIQTLKNEQEILVIIMSSDMQ